MEHRLQFGVVSELPNFLRTTTRDCNLRGPIQCLLSRRDLDDCHSAYGLWFWTIGDGPIGGDDTCPAIAESTSVNVRARVDNFLEDCVSSFSYCGHVIVGNVVHGTCFERDHESRHLFSLFRRPPSRHVTKPTSLPIQMGPIPLSV